jgi:hypothetical protein
MARAFDARPDHPAVHTLVRLHADIGGQIQRNKQQAERLADEMRAVEIVIRMFDPAFDICRISVKRGRPTAKHIRDLFGAVNRSLQTYKGKTVTTVGEGMPVRWAIAR